MAKGSPSQLSLPAVDELLVLCEEVTRATPEGVRRFIEPAPGVLSRAKSNQHHLVFGRRGSGKSSLLRKTAADLTVDRRPIAFVDMETFKGHTYPDVLISVLIKSLYEFKKWLDTAATAPATKKTFWQKLYDAIPKRAPFNKTKTAKLSTELEAVIAALEKQLQAPEVVEKQTKQTSSNENSAGLELGADIPGTTVKGKANLGQKSGASFEEQSKYISHKVEYLHKIS